MQSGLTPLHLAAQEDKVNVAEVLLNSGADVNPQTKVKPPRSVQRMRRRASDLTERDNRTVHQYFTMNMV